MSQTFAEALDWVPKSAIFAETLGRAHDYAKAQSHRLVTLEHLLLALAADPDAGLVLRASAIDVRRLEADISGYLGLVDDRVLPGTTAEPLASPDLVRILDYAAAAARQSKRREINGAIVLAAIVGEGRSAAATMLQAQGLTFNEAIKALQKAAAPPTPDPAPASPPPPPAPAPLPTVAADDPFPPVRPAATVPPAMPRPMAPPPAEDRAVAAEPSPRRPDGAPPLRPPPAFQPPAEAPRAPERREDARPSVPAGFDGTADRAEPPRPSSPPAPDRPRGPQPVPPWPPVAAPREAANEVAAGQAYAPPDVAASRGPGDDALARRRAAPAAAPPLRRASRFETAQLVENVPRRMQVGVAEAVEVRIAKSDLAALSVGLEGRGAVYHHQVIVTKAMAVRLRAPGGGFLIETASPETQWIEGVPGLVANEYASWRWTVVPQRRGRARLQLLVSARTVGADGLAAETALPDQTIEITVRTNYGQTAWRWMGWIAAAIVGGVLARFGEGLLDVARAALRQIAG